METKKLRSKTKTKSTKQKYTPPKLTRYGEVKNLTQAKGGRKFDFRSNKNTKF